MISMFLLKIDSDFANYLNFFFFVYTQKEGFAEVSKNLTLLIIILLDY